MAFTEHPLRRWAVHEMHLRRFAPIAAPAELIQFVRVVEADEREAEQAALERGVDGLAWQNSDDARHRSGRTASGAEVIWERHTEASTLTMILPPDPAPDVLRGLIAWAEDGPGMVVRATRIFVEKTHEEAEKRRDRMGFRSEDIVCCDVKGGVRLWSDFGLHADGYGRLVLAAGDVPPNELGRTVQRLQELGNYRNLALLGFPMVQQRRGELASLESELSRHAQMLTGDETEDEELLGNLTTISARLEQMRAETGFRLGATRAYASIASDRLAGLHVQPVPGHQSLSDFTERRLTPAIRTCASFTERMESLAERISGVMATLDTRIDSRIKAQNLRLMESMDRSSQLQLRLQNLVEGLSIIAAGYYAVGLLGFIVKGFKGYPHGEWGDVALAAATLPVLLILYLLVRSWRHRVIDSERPPGG